MYKFGSEFSFNKGRTWEVLKVLLCQSRAALSASPRLPTQLCCYWNEWTEAGGVEADSQSIASTCGVRGIYMVLCHEPPVALPATHGQGKGPQLLLLLGLAPRASGCDLQIPCGHNSGIFAGTSGWHLDFPEHGQRSPQLGVVPFALLSFAALIKMEILSLHPRPTKSWPLAVSTRSQQQQRSWFFGEQC